MGELISKIFVCLLIASALGALAAWLLGRLRQAELSDEINLLQRSLKRCEEDNAECERRLNSTTLSLAERSEALERVEQRLAQVLSDASSLRQQYEASQIQVSKLSADLATRDASIAGLNALVGARNEQTTSVGDSSTDSFKNGQIRGLQSELDSMRAKLKDQESLLLSRDTQLRQRELRINELEAQLAEVTQQLQQVRTQLNPQDAALLQMPKPFQSLIERATSNATKSHPRQYSDVPSTRDDIRFVYGVGPAIEKILNENGVYFFKQMASWSEEDIDFFDSKLGQFKGRIRREQWVRSAIEEHYKKYGEWLGKGDPIITIPETNRGRPDQRS